MKQAGTVMAVRGQVAEVAFNDERARPGMHDILITEGEHKILIEVVMSSSASSFYCLVLTPQAHLTRGTRVMNTGRPLMVPVGDGVLGRAFDIFGDPHDDLGDVSRDEEQPLFTDSSHYTLGEAKTASQVMETGIKAFDFFAPLLRGGKAALVGGAGIGKTVILTGLVNRLVVSRKDSSKAVAVFSAVGERSREAQELLQTLTETGVLPQATLILGQMGENPAIRFRTAYAGATIAQYFRDRKGTDVVFFMDNLYRFAQAGYELSTLMNVIPSEDGYQPTLTSEMATLQERLASTKDGSISSFMTVFVPSDDLTDQAVRAVFPYLDTMIILSREVFQSGRTPAIDLLTSTSAALNPLTIGLHHYETYLKAKRLLEEAAALERIVSLIGEAELSLKDQQIFRRARLITSYMTQDLFVSQMHEGREAVFVPMQETIQAVADIVAGQHDDLDPEALRYIGSISDLKKVPARQR